MAPVRSCFYLPKGSPRGVFCSPKTDETAPYCKVCSYKSVAGATPDLRVFRVQAFALTKTTASIASFLPSSCRPFSGLRQATIHLNPLKSSRSSYAVPSTGGIWVYLTPRLKVMAAPSTALYAHLQLPLYQRVNEVNLVPHYGLIFGISHAF